MSHRILIVSNRLPVTLRHYQNEVKIVSSSGGLATGLRAFHKNGETLWVGWPGDHSRIPPSKLEQIKLDFQHQRAVPVFLTPEEIHTFYEGYSNNILWPLFHLQPDRLPLDASEDWQSYCDVNEKFADVVAGIYQPDDIIWVHDYQLALLPAALRRRLPAARIGFFLHIPFPPSDIFRVLPARAEILQGMLGADLVGFHIYPYVRNFALALVRILGMEVDIDHVMHEEREVRIGAFPMGVEPETFIKLAESTRVKKEVNQILKENAGRKLLLGIDRLDYIKGIPRRLLALEKLLADNPDLVGKVRLVQVIVPSRTKVESYDRYRRQIDEIVGRINGAYATVNTVPIHHLHRSIPEAQVVALYCAADALLVTSTRDGMNLVAKEFVASRVDEDGVLVLSELVGAAAQLGEAIQINPYNLSEAAAAIRRALDMPREERRTRMRALRKRVLSLTTREWAESFTSELLQVHAENQQRKAQMNVEGNYEDLLKAAQSAHRLVLLLDYDGTLVPFADMPALARPDSELMQLLNRLWTRPRTKVHIVSGRTRASMQEWFGDLCVGLHAEHGFWSRRNPSTDWVPWRDPAAPWKAKLVPVLERFARNTPGALIEEKTASLAWHYRLADPEFGPIQARELRLFIIEMFSNAPVEVIMAEKVVEVRAAGLHKGVILPTVLDRLEFPYLILAIGDDRTDEDLFRALPEGSLAVKIGAGETAAPFRLADHRATRKFLHDLLA